MQHFTQQAAVMAASQPLLPTHYPQQQQTLMPQTQTNNSNGSSNKYLEQQLNATYQPTYYVSLTCSGPQNGPPGLKRFFSWTRRA
jgi:hypothetical protein